MLLHIELFLGWAPRSRCVSVKPWTRQKILVLTTTPSPRCRCLLQTAAAMPSRRYLSTGNSWSNHRAASCMHTEWNGAISSKFSWRGNKWPELGSIRESAHIRMRIKVRVFSPAGQKASPRRRYGTVSNFREALRSWILACESRRPLTATGRGSRARKISGGE